MTGLTETSVAASERAPAPAPADPGSLLRAVALILRRLGSVRAIDASLFAPASAGDLESVVDWLAQAAGLEGRIHRTDAGELCRSARRGELWLVPTDRGWMVMGGRRAVLATDGGDRSFTATQTSLARVVGNSAVYGVVVGPRLALEDLSYRSTGSKSPWRRLRSLMHLEAAELIALFVHAIALGGLSLAVPIAAQVLVNTIAFGTLVQPLIVLTILLLVVMTFAALIQVIETYAVEVLQRRIFVRVAEDFARRFANFAPEVHETTDVRELANRFFEVVSLQKSAGKLLLGGLGLVLQTIVGLALLAVYHPVLLGFNVALVLALCLVLVAGWGAVPTAIDESEAKYKVAAWLETVADHPHTFQRQGADVFAAVRTNALVHEYLRARRAHFGLVLRQVVGGLGVQAGAVVALLGIGGWLVVQRELTLGQLVAAEIVVGVIGAGFAKMGRQLEALYDLLAGVDKLGKVIDRPQAPPRSRIRGPGGAARVEVRSIVLPSPSQRRVCCVDANVAAGARVLVTGGHAIERRALLELMAGLRAPTSGAILVEGRTWTPARAAASPMRVHLLRPAEVIGASILDNLRVAAPFLDEPTAWAALERVGLARRVSSLQDELHTRLTTRGAPLDGYEVTRLCLARALVAEPNVLLIDHGLDDLGLDPAAQATLLGDILGPDAPWTVLMDSDEPRVRAFAREPLELTPEDID